MPNYNSWLSEGRQEVRERIEGGDEEYEEYIKEEYPVVYWLWDWTPTPPEDLAKELNIADEFDEFN
jgi:hypothetical protein